MHKAKREVDGRKHKGGEEVLVDAFNKGAMQPSKPSEPTTEKNLV